MTRQITPRQKDVDNGQHQLNSQEEGLLQSTTTGVMLGATSTMPINDGEINLDSTRLNKQLQNSQAREINENDDGI